MHQLIPNVLFESLFLVYSVLVFQRKQRARGDADGERGGHFFFCSTIIFSISSSSFKSSLSAAKASSVLRL